MSPPEPDRDAAGEAPKSDPGVLGSWASGRMERGGIRPRNAAYVIIILWLIAVVVFGIIERLVDPDTFHNVWLGMWWALQTVTTVGYGDVVPLSTAGKVIASFMMLGGLSLLAVVTGAITSAFVARAQAERRASGEDPVMIRLDALGDQLDGVKAQLAVLERRIGSGE